MSISCLENAHHHFNPTLSYFFIIFGKRMVQRCQILRNGEKMLNYEKRNRQEKWWEGKRTGMYFFFFDWDTLTKSQISSGDPLSRGATWETKNLRLESVKAKYNTGETQKESRCDILCLFLVLFASLFKTGSFLCWWLVIQHVSLTQGFAPNSGDGLLFVSARGWHRGRRKLVWICITFMH